MSPPRIFVSRWWNILVVQILCSQWQPFLVSSFLLPTNHQAIATPTKTTMTSTIRNHFPLLQSTDLYLSRHRRPIIRQRLASSSSSSSNTNSSNSSNTTSSYRKDDIILEDTDDEEESRESIWLRWMARGGVKPSVRGTNKVILREAEELGGVPRSDRYSSDDWFHITVTLPNSAILRAIRGPVLAVTGWATFLSILHEWMLRRKTAALSTFLMKYWYLPITQPHALTMSALGLLLVFRTNSAYQRFAEGRKIWQNVINSARDMYRMMMLYENEIGLDKRRRLQRLLAAFPYFLRHRIRPNLVMRRLDDNQYERDPENTILLYQDIGTTDNDPEAANVARAEEETGKSRRKSRPLYWVDKRTLPWRLLPSDALEACARAQNRPLWVCDRMARELRSVPDGPNFSARERLALISLVNKLSACIGAAERIHQTVVPLNYARHTLRALTLWLFSFPLAVVKDLHLLTGPTLFLMSWLLFGVYEIGYAIEDPFQGSLRLSILCDTIRRDVLGDELIRKTAFELPHELPPPVVEDSIVAATENKGEWFEKDCHDEIDDGTSGTTTTPKEQVIQSLQGSPTVNMEPDESDAYQ